LSEADLERRKFPIGKFNPPDVVTPSDRVTLIQQIAATPANMRKAVAGLTDEQLDTAYRQGGWTLRQVVQHVPDSHVNAYVRFKWTLTENTPTIKTYKQDIWADMQDSVSGPIELSLALLDALHARWVYLLNKMTDADFAREFTHPEQNRNIRLDRMLALYAWHGQHHVAHITALRSERGW
jgi:uncharacterized damage-inducible protein DinB